MDFACATFGAMQFVASGKTSRLDLGWTHMKHGCGNVVAGSFEAIPIVGTIFGLFRPASRSYKFMPYPIQQSNNLSRPIPTHTPKPRQTSRSTVQNNTQTTHLNNFDAEILAFQKELELFNNPNFLGTAATSLA